MWIDITIEKPVLNSIYPVWLINQETNWEYRDYARLEDWSWYLNDGSINIDRTPYKIIAWFKVPDYEHE